MAKRSKKDKKEDVRITFDPGAELAQRLEQVREIHGTNHSALIRELIDRYLDLYLRERFGENRLSEEERRWISLELSRDTNDMLNIAAKGHDLPKDEVIRLLLKKYAPTMAKEGQKLQAPYEHKEEPTHENNHVGPTKL